MEQLKDIKDFKYFEIDWSFYLIYLLAIIAFLSFFLYLKYKKKQKLTTKQKAINYLKALDFNLLSDKEIVYNFTIYSKIALKDEFEKRRTQLVEQTQRYKYQKNPPPLDETIKTEIKRYINECL
ncbi:MAG: hypothetical protein B1H07_02780 [Campylobacteraceae bacterium 4484_166]|nr:MAG: hypothetical protein B1H07_02780 [Campylobacteraceae bacterium 4484_166]